jgi:hypothetical protein
VLVVVVVLVDIKALCDALGRKEGGWYRFLLLHKQWLACIINQGQNSGEDTRAIRQVHHGSEKGSVSNVDMDGKNTLQIKAIRVVISTFETLPK